MYKQEPISLFLVYLPQNSQLHSFTTTLRLFCTIFVPGFCHVRSYAGCIIID